MTDEEIHKLSDEELKDMYVLYTKNTQSFNTKQYTKKIQINSVE